MAVSTAVERVVAELKSDRELASIRRSLEVYYGDPARDAAMDSLYARFVKPGDLAFDVGSHVGGNFARALGSAPLDDLRCPETAGLESDEHHFLGGPPVGQARTRDHHGRLVRRVDRIERCRRHHRHR